MKILCKQDNGKFYRKLSAFGKIFSDVGHEFVFWNNENKSSFDAFYEQKPDIFIAATSSIDESLIKCIKKYSETKIILVGSFIYRDIKHKKFATDKEIELIKKLKEETGKPDILIGNCTEKTIFCIKEWEKIGCKILASPSAADLYTSIYPKKDEKFISDINFVGNFTDYNSKNLENILYPLINDPNLSVKIFGRKEWPIINYLGFINNNFLKNVICSAKICPVISSLHTQEFGFDCPQFLFDVLSSHGFAACDFSEDANFLLKDYVVFSKNTQNQLEYIYDYLNKDDQRVEISNNAYNFIMNNHTYHHRLIDILKEIDLSEVATSVNDKLSKRRIA